MSQVFFSADTHFGHLAQSIRRGFGDDRDALQRHDEALVANWNRRVSDRDQVWLLGDVALQAVHRVAPFVCQLLGRIHLVPGNHDSRQLIRFYEEIGWTIEPPLKTIKVPHEDACRGVRGHRVVVCHFPLMTWDRSHYGVPHLHGHSHGNLSGPETTRLDVGVDCWDLAPVSWAEVSAALQERSYRVVDHHAPR